MFIYPSPVTGTSSIALLRGESIAISSQGNEPTYILGSESGILTPPEFSALGTLLNQAQTFGPYTYDRTIQIQNRQATVEYSVGETPVLTQPVTAVIQSLDPISYVAPATTFVTPTYEDDSGSVKLVSAGAHGLTAAVAVGASIYVGWSNGTGVNGLYEITALDTDTTGVEITIDYPYELGLGDPSPVLAGEDAPIATFDIPANSVGAQGSINVNLLVTMTVGLEEKNITILMGGETVLDATIADAGAVVIEKTLYYKGAEEFLVGAQDILGPGGVADANPNAVLSIDPTEAIPFVLNFSPADENIVMQLDGYKVETFF